jgi:ubiquitin carboxyl-terminal hydrolase 5/13
LFVRKLEVPLEVPLDDLDLTPYLTPEKDRLEIQTNLLPHLPVGPPGSLGGAIASISPSTLTVSGTTSSSATPPVLTDEGPFLSGLRHPPEPPVPQAEPDYKGYIAQLVMMGFSEPRATRAINEKKAVEPALDWLMERIEDPLLDLPLSDPNKKSSPSPSPQSPSAHKLSTQSTEVINVCIIFIFPLFFFQSLMQMGFTHTQAVNSIQQVGNDADRAVAWIMENLDRSFLLSAADQPADTGSSSSYSSMVSGQLVSSSALESANAPLPLPPPLSLEIQHIINFRMALPPVYSLVSFINHRGLSVHSGHYICFVRQFEKNGTDHWVVYNDEKVSLAKVVPIEQVSNIILFFFVIFDC